MATQVQFRRGTTGETGSFIGAFGEVTVDTTKNVVVIHNGSTPGGFPAMREDGTNMSLSLGSLSSCAVKFLADPDTGIYSPGSNQVSFVTGGVARLAIDSTGAATFTNNVSINGSLAVTGSFTFGLGSAVTPTITFTGDTDTGIYSPGANQVAITTAGVGRLFVDGSGNITLASGSSLVFEGSTNDGFETTLAVVDPTADQVLTLPNVTGTLITTGDTGTITSTMIANGTIVDADISSTAAIIDTKLATISTAGKVSNSATTATSSNTASTIVARDASGNFSAGTITGTFSGSGASLTSLPAGQLTGTIPSGVLGNSNLFVGTTSVALNRTSGNQGLTGISSLGMPGASSGTVTLTPAATAGTTAITIPATSGTLITTGDTGTVTSTMILNGTIVDADINASAAIADTKLATISTAGKVSNSATTATNLNTANAIVSRDASGNFSAGTVTATTFSGSGASLTSIPASQLTGTISSTVLGNSNLFVGTTSIALNRASGNQGLTGISSLAMPGSTSGTITLTPTAIAGTTAITVPATTGTLVTTGDNGTVTSTMILNNTIVDADINASAAIAGTKISPDFGSQTIATTGIFSHALGTASAPTITFTGDTNTGIYSPGADQVAISTGGSGRLFVDASGNVGIGAATIRAQVHIAGVGQSTANLTDAGARGGMLRLSGTGASGGEGGALLFTNNQGDAANSLGFAAIKGLLTDGSNNTAGDLAFATRPTSASTSLQERLRITSAGLVGIGTSSPRRTLDITGGLVVSENSGGIYNGYLLYSNSANANARNYGVFSNFLAFGDFGVVQSNALGGDPTSVGTTRLYINSTGNVGIGTSSPGAKLQVSETSGTGPVFLADFTAIAASQNPLLRIIHRNAANTTTSSVDLYKVYQSGFNIINNDTDASNFTSFTVGASERARIDSSGRLLVGTSSARSNFFNSTLSSAVHVESASNSGRFLSLVNNGAGGGTGGGIILGSSAGANGLAVGELGIISFQGNDGTEFVEGARIEAIVDGTSSANDMPSRLVFSTTADGASSPTERLRITSAGNVGIGTTSPGSALEVVGAPPEIRIRSTTASDGFIRFTNTSGSMSVGMSGAAQNIFLLSDRTNGHAAYQYVGGASGAHIWLTANTERARIDSSGRLLIGTSSALSNISIAGTLAAPTFQIQGATGGAASASITRTTTGPGYLTFSAGSSGNNVANNNGLGAIQFNGFDGTNYINSASISSAVDGTPGTNDMPGRLVFSTTADGASSPTERLRITSAGLVGVGTSSPADLLHINGGVIRIQRDVPQILFRSADGTSNQYYIGANISDTVDGGFLIGEGPGITGGTPRIAISGAGNVGIGTSSPSELIHASRDQNAATLIRLDNINTGSSATAAVNLKSGAKDVNIAAYGAGSSFLIQGFNGIVTQYQDFDTHIWRSASASEYARINSSGRLLVGTSSPIVVPDGQTFPVPRSPQFQIAGIGSASVLSSIAFFNTSDNSAEGAGCFSFSRSNTETIGSHAIVSSNDVIGKIGYSASDGASYIEAASIIAAVDGTPGLDDMPGRLVFSTTADGASSPTERLRINSVGQTMVNSAGSASAPVISKVDDTNTGIFFPAADTIAFAEGGTEVARIDSSGRLLVGTSSAYSVPTGDGALRAPGLQRVATTFADSTISAVLFNTAATGGGTLNLGRSNTTSIGTEVIAANNDVAGAVYFSASDGAAQIRTAQIFAAVDGTPGANDMPGRLVFSTTADGASTPTERMRISSAGTTTLTSAASTAPFIANISASEVARIDSSGRLLVGTSTARANLFNSTIAPAIQLEGAGITPAQRFLSVINNFATAGDGGGVIALGRSKGGTVGSNTVVAANDQLGRFDFQGNDGTEFVTGATIEGYVDGTPGANDMPGRIVLSTTLDGTVAPVERFRITNDGVIAHDQPAPAAVNATATLTVANLKAGIITSTSAAATDMTLPTGTDTQAGFSGTYDNFTFEWSVINTGPSLVRVLAGTAHTIVGSGSVATGTSGRFASRRTAANTFVSYRLS